MVSWSTSCPVDILQQSIQLVIYSLALIWTFLHASILLNKAYLKNDLKYWLLLTLIIALTQMLPLYRGSSFIEIVRGFSGDISITSGILLAAIVIKQISIKDAVAGLFAPPLLHLYEKKFLLILGAILYSSTFGFINFDIYYLGYSSAFMLLIVCALSWLLIMVDHYLGYAWLVALVAFYKHWQISNNLWDYLYDPILWLTLFILEFTSPRIN